MMVNVGKYTSPMVPCGSCKQMALFFRCRVASATRNDLLLLRHALPWNAVGGRSRLDGGAWFACTCWWPPGLENTFFLSFFLRETK